MKILVVAYAFNPYLGSEPGVGWAIVEHLSKRHDVWVITDIHNKSSCDKAFREGIIPTNVHLRFLRQKSLCSKNRFIAHLQSWMNYSSFNRYVLDEALAWHEENNFDLCHQVTIASWRMPSNLWKLPIPFVWGPIGGAGFIPYSFRTVLSRKAKLFELVRDLTGRFSIKSKSFKHCMKNAAVVIAANQNLIRPLRGNLAFNKLPVTSMSKQSILRLNRPSSFLKVTDSRLRLFAGGNMEGRKGISIALRALALCACEGMNFRYIVAGDGPEIPSLRQLAISLKISDRVVFCSGFSGDDYCKALWDSDVYFLPSLRETMGMTLVEAILAGCYPLVANTSAQGEIVKMAGGIAVDLTSVESTIKDLAKSLLWCDLHRDELFTLGEPIRQNVSNYIDSERVQREFDRIYDLAIQLQ